MCLGPSYASRNSRYQNLLAPLDLYSVPTGQEQVLDRAGLYGRIAKKGLPIRLAREDFKLAKEDFRLSYDNLNIPRTTISSTYSYSQADTAGTSIQTKSYTAGLGLAGDLGWGLQYSLNLPSVTHSLTDTTGIATESDTAAIGLGVTVNLLKGSFLFLQRNLKNSADATLELSRASLKQTALQTLIDGELTFYDCLLKQARVKVLEQALQNAKALLQDVEEIAKAGETEKLSVVKVELQVAQTETDLLTAQSDLQTARQSLRNIIALNPNESLEFFPDPRELKTAPPEPDLNIQKAIETAKTKRPDFMSATLTKRIAELSEQHAFSSYLPSLNFKSSYGYGGTYGTMSEALSQTFGMHTPVYSVGLEFSYSLFNDADKTAYRKAKITNARSSLAIVQLQNQITKELNSAIQNVQLGYRRLKTSELARSLAEQKLAAEFVKFRVGESNIRNVIDFQTEVNNARIGEVSARVFLFTQLAVYRNALGELPEGIQLEELK